MKKISVVDRILLLLTGLAAAYQVAVGIEGLGGLTVLCYTIAFGVLLIAGLLLIIFGFEVLESPLVVVVAAIIPLSLSLGLVAEYLPAFRTPYLIFVVAGLLAILITRYAAPRPVATVTLATVHGVAGLLIFGLPIILSLQGVTRPGFALVGVGGALIGIGGLLLAFLRVEKPILSQETIYKLLPGLLLLMTLAFIAGLAMA
ncbi:MAG TPA: hypothetical protein ENI95_12170 [Chloroflexi bacterium]|nr:hypothetical protein [Chloroflexota bacterium]